MEMNENECWIVVILQYMYVFCAVYNVYLYNIYNDETICYNFDWLNG